MKKINFKYQIHEKPEKKIERILLSIQHVFAMFGSTILVPTLVGLSPSISLFTAGLGTLTYTTITSKKVPIFIGSSFAYIAILTTLNKSQGMNGVANAVIATGLIYILIAFIIKLVGTKFLDYILPPVVIAPVIIVIGLGLAPVAIGNSGFSMDTSSYQQSYTSMLIAFVTLISTTFYLIKGKKMVKLIPILCGIITGYVFALILDLFSPQDIVNTSKIFSSGVFSFPNFAIPGLTYDFSFQWNIFIMVIPIIFVTIAEHIGEHTVSSTVMDKNFLKDPGLSKTLLGDGLATLFAGFLGGPVNTTYAENTGVIILTKIASVYVIRLAAVFAMILAFLTPIVEFINSIPLSVMGGISISLFGLIAQNGIRILISSNIDITNSRNMIIIATILVIGVGNAVVSFNIGTLNFVFSGMSLAAVIGIALHLILPDKKVSYSENKLENVK